MCERDSQLNQELTEAFEDEENFDFGFEKQREATGFNNFEFDPAEAERMRQAELERIEAEQRDGG